MVKIFNLSLYLYLKYENTYFDINHQVGKIYIDDLLMVDRELMFLLLHCLAFF
jgi:hypothetical protein